MNKYRYLLCPSFSIPYIVDQEDDDSEIPQEILDFAEEISKKIEKEFVTTCGVHVEIECEGPEED